MTEHPLIAFLRARLDEDEQVARDASAGAWRKAERPSIWVSCENGPVAQTKYFEDAAHIARHHPARTLAEVEAKRLLLEQFRLRANSVRRTVQPATGGVWDDLLRLLALPYADHDDYKEEWRP